MQSNYYDSELQQLSETYVLAMETDVSRLKAVIAGASESSIIGVGSGGSYTVASLLCNLHETYTGRVSRPSTPLEIICNPTLAASSPVFLISAEGKNPDIVLALQRARRHSARTVHVLTNRANSPLTKEINNFHDVSADIFELTQKDGYLATNSLLFDAVLVARTYGELAKIKYGLPNNLSELRIGKLSLPDWLGEAQKFVSECVNRGAITVIYSPLLKPIAVDLESKLSEAALIHTQFTDIRSYAHGRHLWLANRPQDCAILAITDSSIGALWNDMKKLIPENVPNMEMNLAGATPTDLISGLVAQMYLVSAIGHNLHQDPGKPDVPDFGRKLYYTELQDVIPVPQNESDGGERLKYDALGARWPFRRNQGSMRRAKEDFIESLEKQNFRAIVFDYDGTLNHSQRGDSAPPKPVLDQIVRLVQSGVIVGIASGRGGSIQECLRDHLPQEILCSIQLGLYNGGWVGNAESVPISKHMTSEFLSHVTRIIFRLKELGVPIDEYKTTHPYQVSVRFRDGISTEQMWFVIADALRQAGLDLSRIAKSKHSVDILAAGVSKSRLIAQIIQTYKIDPYHVLTIGDQGAWPGNDAALLEHRYSLSVDVPSRRLDRGWKLAPPHLRDVAATLWYLENFILDEAGSFSVSISSQPLLEVEDA